MTMTEVYSMLDVVESIDPRRADMIRDEVLSIYDPGTDTLDADCLPAIVRLLMGERS